MHIAIIGTGNVGSTLGKAWSAKGYAIHYGVRNPQASPLPQLTNHASVMEVSQAIDQAGLVVLALPWTAAQEVVTHHAKHLANKILVDCTNPIAENFQGLTIGHSQSAAEVIQSLAPQSKVVKAFNTTGYNIMAQPQFAEHKALMLVAGDDAQAVSTVEELSHALGFETYAFDRLDAARLLEPFALVWIQMAYRLGLGRDFAFGILKR